MTASGALIGVDWGSTNLRAFLFSDTGSVVDTRRGPAITSDHARTLKRFLAPWLTAADALPILICGMAGARGGWQEAAYAVLPVSVNDLASHTTTAADFPAVAIVPGARRPHPGRPDVMRGEEVQALGAGVTDGLVIAPGTHSKWITMSAGKIVDLRTFVTGDLYAGLLKLGFLAGVTKGEAFDQDAFLRGVADAASGESLLELIFSLRADVLVNGFAETAVATRLSGLLIGCEVSAAHTALDLSERSALVCEEALADLYLLTFDFFGLGLPERFDPIATTARGLWAVHIASGRRTPS